MDSPKSKLIVGIYTNDLDEKLQIQVKLYQEKFVQQIEKGETFFENYKKNGMEFFIFNNTEQFYACWMKDNIEYWIISDASLEVLYDMIDSIEGGT